MSIWPNGRSRGHQWILTQKLNSQRKKQCQVSNAVRDGATQVVIVEISAHKYKRAGKLRSNSVPQQMCCILLFSLHHENKPTPHVQWASRLYASLSTHHPPECLLSLLHTCGFKASINLVPKVFKRSCERGPLIGNTQGGSRIFDYACTPCP